jgi:hypothetical protein
LRAHARWSSEGTISLAGAVVRFLGD